MCGIVGYIGGQVASEFLIDGLRRLEYRGYDSSGVVTHENGGLAVTKTTGRIDRLADAVREATHEGTLGIGHTRWATHGQATDTNAHPHVGGDGVLALVHNGVIENYAAIKERLVERGYAFQSDTDSEVVAHLIAAELEDVLEGGTLANDPDPYAPPIAAVRSARLAPAWDVRPGGRLPRLARGDPRGAARVAAGDRRGRRRALCRQRRLAAGGPHGPDRVPRGPRAGGGDRRLDPRAGGATRRSSSTASRS